MASLETLKVQLVPNALYADDLNSIVRLLPKDITALLTGLTVSKAFLAGGYIRARIARETVNDIDIIGDSAELMKHLAYDLQRQRDGIGQPTKVFRTKNAYTVLTDNRTPVQFIYRWNFSNAKMLIESFDFTIAQACIWWNSETSTWQSYIGTRFYADLAAKRLVYNMPIRHEEAGGSPLRVQKFLRKGYDISPENFSKVMARLMGAVDTNSHLWQADEMGRAQVLNGLLRQVDPLTTIDGLQPTDDSFDTEEAPKE